MMILLTCSCLNVRVHGKGNTFSLEETSHLQIPENVSYDPFFESQVYSVTLDLAGVSKSQKDLCSTRSIENWDITSCGCCTMDIFAKRHGDNDRVLVSPKAETNSNYISSLMDSDRYSSLFKLVLPEINDNFIQNNIGIEFQNGNIDSSIELVQSQVSNYIKYEQKAMEERIRQFTEQQQSMYADLLQKVRKNKQAMVYLMIKCKETGVENETVTESSVGSPLPLPKDLVNESSTSTDSAFDRSEAPDLPLNETTRPQNLRTLRRTVSNPTRSKEKVKRELKHAPLSIDVGGVFDMEVFDPKDTLSYSSEDDSDESDTGCPIEVTSEKCNDFGMCASSLPMSIPALSNLSRYSPLEEDRDSLPKAPKDIAASMRALACSVRDGTEMFGELPRRRLNTGELLAFRPF